MNLYGYRDGVKRIDNEIAQDVGIGTNGTC